MRDLGADKDDEVAAGGRYTREFPDADDVDDELADDMTLYDDDVLCIIGRPGGTYGVDEEEADAEAWAAEDDDSGRVEEGCVSAVARPMRPPQRE